MDAEAREVLSVSGHQRQSSLRRRRNRRKGLAIAACGVLVVTPDAALVRWGQEYLVSSDAPLLFWKNVATFTIAVGVALWLDADEQERRAPKVFAPLWQRIAKGWPYFCTAALCQAFIAVSFPIAFMLTYSSNVVVLYSLSPLTSAMLGSLCLGDPLPCRTACALVGSTMATCVVFLPQLVANTGSTTVAGRVGDLIALATGVANSIFLVVVRAGLAKHPELPVPMSSAVGVLFGAIAALAWGDVTDISNPIFFVPMLIDGGCIALIIVAFSLAPRYTSAAEIGLISLLETVLSPIWVFLCFGERPPHSTVLGGAILIISVAGHEFASLAADKTESRSDTTKRPLVWQSANVPQQDACDLAYATFHPQGL